MRSALANTFTCGVSRVTMVDRDVKTMARNLPGSLQCWESTRLTVKTCDGTAMSRVQRHTEGMASP